MTIEQANDIREANGLSKLDIDASYNSITSARALAALGIKYKTERNGRLFVDGGIDLSYQKQNHKPYIWALKTNMGASHPSMIVMSS